MKGGARCPPFIDKKSIHMVIEYRIMLHARTTSGFDTFGEFFIGNDKQAAKELFNTLKGSSDDMEDGLLLMELREINRNLPLDIEMIHCTLNQLADNCRLITKNQFKTLNLKCSDSRFPIENQLRSYWPGAMHSIQ